MQTLVPTTYDVSVLKQNLDGVSLANLQWWSDIIGSLRWLIESMSEDTGTIFLISDGEIMGSRVDLKDSYLELPSDIALWTIGVGTTEGGYIPLWRDLFGKTIVKMIDGNPIISKYSSDLLQKITKNGGAYQQVTKLEALKLDSKTMLPKDLNHIVPKVLSIGSFCLLLGILLPYRRRITQ